MSKMGCKPRSMQSAGGWVSKGIIGRDCIVAWCGYAIRTAAHAVHSPV
ncbi:MAG TPA: hypothetical protein VK619_03975 [Pyrinomonadaceae bacterium]|nr:hypothetical protein [Pyrinomonadaceae bacterium]